MTDILDRYRYHEAKRINEKQQQYRPGIAQRLQTAEEGVLGKPGGGFGTLLQGLFSIVWPEATVGQIGGEKLGRLLLPQGHENLQSLVELLGGAVGALGGDPEAVTSLIQKGFSREGIEAAQKEFGSQATQAEIFKGTEEASARAYKNFQKMLGGTGKKDTEIKFNDFNKILMKGEGYLHSAQVKAMLMNPRISLQKLLTDTINLPVQAVFKGIGVGQEQGMMDGVKTTLSALQAYRMTFKDALRYGIQSAKTGEPEFLRTLGWDDKALTYAGESEKAWIDSEHASGLRFLHSFTDSLSAAYGYGTRMIMGADQFAKAMAYSGEIRMGAFRDGLEQAEQRGLVGAAKYHFADLWQEELYNHTPDWLHESATQGMMKSTFTDQGNVIMQWLQQGRRIPGVRVAVPFFRTPINLMKAGLEISPLNLSWLWKGDLEQNVAMGKFVVGSAIYYELAEQTARGNITGDGPSGPGKEQWPGYKHPRSIRVGGSWYSYKNLGPFAEIISLAADSTEMYHGSQQPDQMQRLIDTVGKVFVQQAEHAPFWEETFNLLHTLDSFKQGGLDQTGKEFLSRLGTSFQPSPIREEAQIEDPVIHDAKTLKDNFAENVPGWGKHLGLPTSFSVPAKQDEYGHDVHPSGAYDATGGVSKLHYLANQINPFPTYPDLKPDPVDEEQWKLGMQPLKWPTAYFENPEPGAKFDPNASIALSPQQQKELADYAGHEYKPGGLDLHDRKLKMIQSSIYQRMDPASRKQQLEGLQSGYISAGQAYISRKYPGLRQQYADKQRQIFKLRGPEAFKSTYEEQ